ncbi:MAG: hypothetical protein IK127_04255 [Clostridia bacterium]|nr:hypothetical protein [Clostridia bacterium]
MDKRKTILILQSAVCILLAAALISAAIVIFLDGTARKAANPKESIYTAEIVAKKLSQVAPLMVAAVVILIVGLIFGVKDENAEKPVKARLKPRKGESELQGVIQAAVVVAAAVLILAGILNGSARDMLIKAITICTECIGLG